MKSPSTGLAGAVRIQQLKMSDLAFAERHGNRLDKTSQLRAINEVPPLTTTGFDLVALYHKHVAGAFIPKANAKAMHVIIQFPTDLVDGDDAAFMLHHARTFAERVFGSEAIFGDRVDRDEKSRHVVDIFVAPKYLKKTAHAEKTAVSMTRHLKALAKRYGRKTNVYETGRALQDALHDYLKNDMGLEDALRGSPKLAPGADWKASEQLRLEELNRLKASAEADVSVAGEIRDDAEVSRAAALEERRAAEAERRRQELATMDAQAHFRDAELERKNAIELRLQAKEARAEAERIKEEAERLRAAAERQLEVAAEEMVQRQRDANRVIARAQDELAAARQENEEIQKKRSELRRESDALAEERKRDGLRLDLLERAMDDSNGLNLRPTADAFTMDHQRMSSAEQEAYRSPWPNALFAIARRLADALDKVRKLLKFAHDERETLNRRRNDLDAAEARIREREAGLASDKADLERRASSVADQIDTARRQVEQALKAERAQVEWGNILKLLAQGEISVVERPDGRWIVTAVDPETVPPWIGTRALMAPPAWAKSAFEFMKTLNEAAQVIDRQERVSASHAAALKLVVQQADKAFTPAQKAAVLAAESVLSQHSMGEAAFRAAQKGSGRG